MPPSTAARHYLIDGPVRVVRHFEDARVVEDEACSNCRRAAQHRRSNGGPENLPERVPPANCAGRVIGERDHDDRCTTGGHTARYLYVGYVDSGGRQRRETSPKLGPCQRYAPPGESITDAT